MLFIIQMEPKLDQNWYLIANPRGTILLLSLYYLNTTCAVAHLGILIFKYTFRVYQVFVQSDMQFCFLLSRDNRLFPKKNQPFTFFLSHEFPTQSTSQ